LTAAAKKKKLKSTYCALNYGTLYVFPNIELRIQNYPNKFSSYLSKKKNPYCHGRYIIINKTVIRQIFLESEFENKYGSGLLQQYTLSKVK
jgi:hypothetical protein